MYFERGSSSDESKSDEDVSGELGADLPEEVLFKSLSDDRYATVSSSDSSYAGEGPLLVASLLAAEIFKQNI